MSEFLSIGQSYLISLSLQGELEFVELESGRGELHYCSVLWTTPLVKQDYYTGWGKEVAHTTVCN